MGTKSPSFLLPRGVDSQMDVFIAGVMQGSREDQLIVDQDYRQLISQALTEHVAGVRIVDPRTIDPDSVNYNREQARYTFLKNTALAAHADVLIAYLPQASMGTAIEMWTAFKANVPIIAISSLKYNWVIGVTSDLVLPDLDSLLEYIRSGQFENQWSRRK